ncbi:MAG: hypothetical protein ABGY71_09255 [bacterium]|jgi:hypothetical protein|nr:hypothetical protein [Planctomycetota bacterium]HIL52531.1 hypothetical protein [Planctomycetota bacterium]
MEGINLASQFCLQLAFGVLLALAFVPRAPVGRLFYRLMGTTALLPLLVAAVLPLTHGERPWSDPAVLSTWAAVAAWPFFSGSLRGKAWALALGWALLACVAALVFTLGRVLPTSRAPELALAALSALATGAVAGSVGLAMVLGHWYLTVPKLKVEHLGRLNRVTIGALLASVLCLGLSLLLFRERLDTETASLFGPRGLFHLGTRVLVGLVLPLLFAAMARGSLQYGNTRSATGILYASTVLVLIGTALSLNLQDSYGLPL